MEKKKIVLAIDDNKMQLDLFQKMLGEKYELRTVNSASSAMMYLNTSPADVVLLDIEMPYISGFDFLNDIRTLPSYFKVPIIIVSGQTGQDFLNKARNSSAFEVLSKPVNSEVLIKTIEKALAS